MTVKCSSVWRNGRQVLGVKKSMELPRVNPVGIVERPAPGRPRRYPLRVRVPAVIALATFVTVSMVTTVISLGAYCLTSGTGPVPEGLALGRLRRGMPALPSSETERPGQ